MVPVSTEHLAEYLTYDWAARIPTEEEKIDHIVRWMSEISITASRSRFLARLDTIRHDTPSSWLRGTSAWVHKDLIKACGARWVWNRYWRKSFWSAPSVDVVVKLLQLGKPWGLGMEVWMPQGSLALSTDSAYWSTLRYFAIKDAERWLVRRAALVFLCITQLHSNWYLPLEVRARVIKMMQCRPETLPDWEDRRYV